MLKIHARVILRLALGATIGLALAVAPALAQAQAPGSLNQLGGANSCIAAGDSECPTTNGTGLNGSEDVAISPDGNNVYVVGSNDDAIAEFSRGSDGSLREIGCVVDPSNDSTSSCTDGTPSPGLVFPQSIAISPDGANVYVGAQDSDQNGTITEFARGTDGSLTPLDCIAEVSDSTTPCGQHNGRGIGGSGPTALAVSPDGQDVYAVDQSGEDVATFARATDGSLSEPDGCIQDVNLESNECGSSASGMVRTTGVVVSPDGATVYTTGWDSNNSEDGAIAQFTRNPDGSLTQPSSSACVQTQGDNLGCATTAVGMLGEIRPIISPDGRNVYTASQAVGGPIAEFSRDSSGTLSQLPAPNDCLQEGTDVACSSTGRGIGTGFELAISPDGASVYAAAPAGGGCSTGSCADVAEFARNADGSLAQLSPPDACIQDTSQEGSECPGNEGGLGLGGPGVAVSPDGASVYVTGSNDIAAFARIPVTHTLTVSLAGSGSGAVSDQTGGISCPSTCAHAYTANSPVTLTATPASGSTFTGWSGACSGTGTCQVTMSADLAVTATFTANGTPPSPGAPTPVLTGAPTAVTDAGAGFLGSVNPEGLPTTVFFQYGLDKRYSQVGASGPNYTQQTPAQTVGSDFTTHGIGPVAVSGLLPNALYHVRLVATNTAGTAFGAGRDIHDGPGTCTGSPDTRQDVQHRAGVRPGVRLDQWSPGTSHPGRADPIGNCHRRTPGDVRAGH